jgi:pimeloyl-ACP methyl ester carboxylesterase
MGKSMKFRAHFAWVIAGMVIAAGNAVAQDDTTSSKAPVKAVGDHLLPVTTATRGKGNLPFYCSVDGKIADLTQAQPDVVRALIVFHGKLRNADVYNRSGLEAVKNAGAAGKGTLLITPQFLAEEDAAAFHLPPNVLRWGPEEWMGGNNALNGGPSSFDAIDAILALLADKKEFPNLKSVVLAGHSGGGQVMQRYAVVGRGGDALTRAGVHVRYVVANPSSYVYFSPERPVLDVKSEFKYAVPSKTCYGKYDRWKYGVHDVPPYVGDEDFVSLEQRFLRRDVVYLLGTNDVDPNHPALDKSCSGEVEGAYRFFRGKAYFKYLEIRHPELGQESASQKLWFVPGVEHDGDKMLNSPCGLAALFDAGSCSTRVLDPRP